MNKDINMFICDGTMIQVLQAWYKSHVGENLCQHGPMRQKDT